MKKNSFNVLIAILPEKKDWQILHEQNWYRIPIDSAPPIIRRKEAKFIAFYHTAKFDTDLKWKVVTYAKIKKISTVYRKELFPQENLNSPKSSKQYFKIDIFDLKYLEKPFVSRRGHRITFIPTSEEKLFSGKIDFNILFKGSILEEKMVSILENMGVEYEREWQTNLKGKMYYLDFAIFCQNGKGIDIECDGNEFHMGDENVHYDKTRGNNLESYGWSVLRFTTKHFLEDISYIQETIYKKILDFGGVKQIEEPQSPYIPKNPNDNQLRLFD